jgi:hypothetical protein
VGGYLAHPSRNIQWYTGNRLVFDTAGPRPHQVDIEPLVERRVVSDCGSRASRGVSVPSRAGADIAYFVNLLVAAMLYGGYRMLRQ